MAVQTRPNFGDGLRDHPTLLIGVSDQRGDLPVQIGVLVGAGYAGIHSHGLGRGLRLLDQNGPGRRLFERNGHLPLPYPTPSRLGLTSFVCLYSDEQFATPGGASPSAVRAPDPCRGGGWPAWSGGRRGTSPRTPGPPPPAAAPFPSPPPLRDGPPRIRQPRSHRLVPPPARPPG